MMVMPMIENTIVCKMYCKKILKCVQFRCNAVYPAPSSIRSISSVAPQ